MFLRFLLHRMLCCLLLISTGLCQSPPSQCVETFRIVQDMMNISIVSGAVNCFSCALDAMDAVDWLVEMDGEVVTAEESPDVITNSNFLIVPMPISFISSATDGICTIACVSQNDEQILRATLSLDISCVAETASTENGMIYSWPTTLAGETAILACQTRANTLVTRNCSNVGLWQNVSAEGCDTVSEQLLGLNTSFANLTIETYVDSVAMLSQIIEFTENNTEEQTSEVLSITANYFRELALFVNESSVIINSTVIEDVVDVVNSFLQWEPGNILVASSSSMVESFEIVAFTYAQQLSLNETQTFTALSFTLVAELRSVSSLSQNGRSFQIGDNDLLLGPGDQVEPDQLPDQLDAAISLPASLFQRINDRLNVGIFFAHYDISSLFPVAGESSRSSLPRQTVVGSDIIAATVGPGLNFQNLDEAVTILLRLQVDNETFIAEGSETCVSWDFTLQDWTTEGCTTIVGEDGVVTCNCTHLTNFAVLVDICLRQESCEPSRVDTALTYISYIGTSISIVCLLVTLLTLLVFKKIREKDIAKYHIQLCSALLCMYILTLILVVLSAERVDTIYGGCVTLSLLVHYFTLAAVMWMGAEGLLMFQKLVIVFVRVTTKFIIIVSVTCWAVPIVFVLVPFIVDMANGQDVESDIIIQRANMDNDISYCFLSHIGALVGAFLAPIFIIMVVNVIFFICVIVVVIRHTKETAKRMKQTVTNKQILRISFSISGVLFLFGLTWLFFVLTVSVSGLRETFQILFTVFNSLQGFFVFVFIIFTEGFGHWKKAFLSCKKLKSKSSQSSVPTTNNIISTTKSGTTPSSLPRQENSTSDTAHLNAKNTENANGELELQFSSNAASSTELVSNNNSNFIEDQVIDNHDTTMYPNDTKYDHGGSQQQEDGSEFKGQTDSKPLKIFAKRYSTKRYKQHHVEVMRIEFHDEDSSSSDEDGLDA